MLYLLSPQCITHDLLSSNLRMWHFKSMLHCGHGFASAMLHKIVSPFLNEACNGLQFPILHHKLCCEQKLHSWHRQSIQFTKCVPLSDFPITKMHQNYLPKLFPFTFRMYGSGSSVGIATDYGLDGPGSNPGGNEIFRPSRSALGPTQSPVQWVPGLSRG